MKSGLLWVGESLGDEMSKFLDPLIIEKVDGTADRWRVATTFRYQSDLGGLITVPKGEVTDFASTPQLVWAFFPKSGLWDGAALVHDMTYRLHSFSRKKCDEVFLEALEVLNVSSWKRYTMYWAVRLGGWVAY